jgi:hypothetical protein
LSQVANGVWLPVVLIFILLLINRTELMGDYVNTRTFNIVSWTVSIVVIILTLILVYTTIAEPSAAGLSGPYFTPSSIYSIVDLGRGSFFLAGRS